MTGAIKTGALLAAALVAASIPVRAAPARADGAASWAGNWEGTLENFPARPGPKIKVQREVGAWPAKDGECSTFRTRYFEGEELKATKDYKLCRGTGSDDLYVDEGDVAEGKSVRLPARLLGGVLVSPFKFDSLLLFSLTRVENDVMTEEIHTASDVPMQAGAVVELKPRSLQRLVFWRAKRASALPR